MESARSQVVLDRSALVLQVESVERSIVFLRQEQLTMLQALHLEILSLQKRCTELTQELNLKPPGKSEIEVREEEERLEARCRDAEGRLREQERSHGELRQELGHKGALVGALRASLKEKERRFLEELKRRSHRTAMLNGELQKQTEAAAYLSFQLHTAKQRLQHQQRRRLERAAAGADKPLPRATPLPASGGGPPAVKPKRRGGSGLASCHRAERARECVPCLRITGPEEPTAMPDPALFLRPCRPAAWLHHGLAPQGAAGGEGRHEPDQADPAGRLTAPIAAAASAEGQAE
ncbi:coiled-coil domain-containing 92B [Brachyhypopomus gauderio]|uniref:coiled-coil domain-containing 92B n=1 Tax=Brachyhypopomus gauderio TaxID=698409 RepID=UPI00404387CD